MLKNTIKSSILPLILGLILFISPLLRFSWDFAAQSLLIALILALFIILLNFYEFTFSFKTDGLLILFFICAAISIINAVEPAHVRNGLLFLLSSMLVFFLSGFLNAGQKRKLLAVPVAAGFLLTGVLFFYFLKNPSVYFLYETLPYELIINPNVAAGYLLLVFFLSFLLWKTANNEIYFKVLSAFLFSGIFLTRSRTAIVVASVFGIYYLFSELKNAGKLLKFIIPVILSVLVFISFVKFNIGTFIFDRFVWWKAAWHMILGHPLFGVGWGNFENYYLFYRSDLIVNTLYAHNLPLQLLAETGIIGFCSFAALLSSIFYFLRKNYSADPELNKIITVSIAAFLIFNLFDYSFYIPAHLLLFWAVLGTAFSRNPEIRSKPLFNPIVSFFTAFIVVLPVIIMFAASLYYQKALLAFADNPKKAEYLIEKAIKYDPSPSIYYYKASEIFAKLYIAEKNSAYFDKAVVSQRKALEINPFDSRIWADIAWLYLSKNNYDMAESSALNAVKYDRLNPKYPKILLEITKMAKNEK